MSVIGRETPIRGDIIVFVVASFSSASGYIRFAIVESLGIKDVVAKSTGSSNPHNMIKATFDAFKKSESPKSVAAKRTIKVSAINSEKKAS